MEEDIKVIKKHVASGQLGKAIALLLECCRRLEEMEDEALLLSFRWSEVNTARQQILLTWQEAHQVKTGITQSLLASVKRLVASEAFARFTQPGESPQSL